MLGFGAGVFSTVEGAQVVDFTDGLSLGIVGKPGADIRQFTAGPAAEALALAVFGDG